MRSLSIEPKTKSKSGIHVALVKGNAEFVAWFQSFSDTMGVPGTTLIDMALKDFAAKHEFSPMPRRIAR